MNKNNLLILIAVGVFILVGLGGAVVLWYLGESSKSSTGGQQETMVTTGEEETADDQAVVSSKDISTESLDESIKNSLSQRHDWDVDKIEISMGDVREDYASGTVGVKGETGGGWFLAAKVDGSWVVAADGNGSVYCDHIEKYDFPTDMVPECWDLESMSLMDRTAE